MGGLPHILLATDLHQSGRWSGLGSFAVTAVLTD